MYRLFLNWPHRCARPGRSEFQAGAEFDGERTDVATCHDVSGILSGVFLFDQFGTGDTAFSTRLVQEVHDGAAQGQFLVHLPVQSAEGLPATVEVVGVVDVGVGLAEVAEAGPDLQVLGDHVAGVYFDDDLRDFGYDIACGVDFAHVSVGEGDRGFILLVSWLLVGEEEVQVESLEGAGNDVGGPTQRLDVVGQRGSHDFGLSGGSLVLQVQRRVVVRLRDVGEERGQAQPFVVVVDSGTPQGYGDLVRVGQGGRGEVFDFRMLGDVGEVAGEAE